MGSLLYLLGFVGLVVAALFGYTLTDEHPPRKYEGAFIQTITPAYEDYMEKRENRKNIACWSLGLGLAFLAIGAIASNAEAKEKE